MPVTYTPIFPPTEEHPEGDPDARLPFRAALQGAAANDRALVEAVAALEARMTTLEERQDNLEARVTALEEGPGGVGDLQQAQATADQRITDLEERVTALETPEPAPA